MNFFSVYSSQRLKLSAVGASSTTGPASVRARLFKMASNIRRITRCFSSLRQSFPLYSKIDLNVISRSITILSRCNLSNAASQVKTSEDEVESGQKETKIPILSDFENRNPRNPEYFGYNKPRGYATQKYRKDFYNK